MSTQVVVCAGSTWLIACANRYSSLGDRPVSRCSRAARAPPSMKPSVSSWARSLSRMASSRCCWLAIRPKSSPSTLRVPAKPVAWSPFIGLMPGVTSRSCSGSSIVKSDVTWSSPTLSTSAWNPAEPVVTTYCGWTPVSSATVAAMSSAPPRRRPSLIFEGSPSNSTTVSLGIPTAADWPVSKFNAISSMASALPSESEPRASTTTTSSSPKSTPVDSSTSTRLNRVGAVCESGTSSSTAPTASAAMPRRSLLMTPPPRPGRRS